MSLSNFVRRLRALYSYQAYQDLETGDKPANLLHPGLEIQQLFGAHTSKDDIHDWFYYLRRGSIKLGLFCLWYLVVFGFPMKIFLEDTDSATVIHLVIVEGCLLIASVNMTTALKQDFFEVINGKLNEIYSIACWTEDQNETLKKTAKYCSILMKTGPISFAVIVTIYWISSIPNKLTSRDVKLSPWTPFDIAAATVYEIYNWTFGALMFTLIGVTYTFLAISFSIAFLIYAQVKVLNSKLRSIRPENIITDVVPDEPGVNKITRVDPLVGIMVDEETDVKVKPAPTGQPVTNENTSKVLGEDDRSASDVVRQRWRQILLEQKKRNEEIKMEIKIVECVKLHQALLSILEILQSITSNILSTLVGAYLIQSCLTAYNLAQSGTILFDVHGIIVISNFVCILFVCVLSEMFTKEFNAVGFSVYDCDWFASSDSFKRSMRIIISRANQVTYFTAAGFIPFSMEMLNALTKTSYSYFTSLRSLQINK